MSKPEHFFNRELSWLEFNQRVLDEASDPSVPLLDRLFFLTITGSNLDEFFMVRVGGLALLAQAGSRAPDPSGRTPMEQLVACRERTADLVAAQYETFAALAVELAGKNIRWVGRVNDWGAEEADRFRHYFKEQLAPVLTPLGVGAKEGPMPRPANLELYVAVQLAPEGRKRKPRLAIVPVSRGFGRVVWLSSAGKHAYGLVEDLVAAYAQRLFPGVKVLETGVFRVTRNADVAVNEEFAEDLAIQMEQVLRRRRSGPCVRLEVSSGMSDALCAQLLVLAEADRDALVHVSGPLDLTGLRGVCSIRGHAALRYTPWVPQQPVDIDPQLPMLDQIAARDRLLVHPYESFDPVVRFLREAGADPQVVAIKHTLYRTSEGSAIADALIAAARAGKGVTALVELKGRFDEENNIAWARSLEQAGVHVVYGVKRLKTHSKITLVVRREPDGIRRYVHFGTGNYNESTAKLYTDVGLFTCADPFGADASMFFNTITGYSEPQQYNRIRQAPLNLRARILELVEGEIERAGAGEEALIMWKMNALVDPEIIDALYRASSAGVRVELAVRGICCLRPRVKGLSENIRVTSVIDRFLEHSRLYYFHQGGDGMVYISSADMMPRNLDRRIELLVPVEDEQCRRKLVHALLMTLADTVKARELQPDGSYQRVVATAEPKRSQEVLYMEAKAAASGQRSIWARVFEQHLPGGD